MTVSDIVSTALATVSPEAEVSDAVQQMAERHLDRILVVEGGNLVGIISEADVRKDEGPLS